MQVELDSQGFPVLLADEPKHEPAPVAPSYEEGRRRDAVREAAREFETLDEQDLKERFRGITTRELDESDLTELRLDIREQQLDDLIDILHQLHMGKLRARRYVRMSAPRGYLRKTLWAITPEEYTELVDRLRARGWKPEDLVDGLDKRFSAKHLKELTSSSSTTQ
mgnify:CR=1 FL=1